MNEKDNSKLNKGIGGFTHSQRVVCYLVVYDLVTTAGAYFLALLLRFDFRFSMIPIDYLQPWEQFAPFYAVYCVIIFWVFRLYKSIWRFASFTELERITIATIITTVVHAIVITLVIRRMPISYYMMGAFLQFIFTVAIRFAYRFILLLRANKKDGDLKKVMLIGMSNIIRVT